MSVEAGLAQSRWREVAASGDTLLTERGSLPLVTLRVEVPSGLAGRWQLALSGSGGERSYDGQTQAGVPLRTASDLRDQSARLQWLSDPSAAWRYGARLQWLRSQRELRSTPQAQGYPERHDLLQAAVVLATGGPIGASGLSWTAEAAAGAGPGSRVRVRLPGYDPVTLATGPLRSLSAGARLSGSWPGGWQWHLGIEHGALRRGAGEPVALRRGGLVMGSVSQPRIHESTTQAVVGIGTAWGR